MPRFCKKNIKTVMKKAMFLLIFNKKNFLLNFFIQKKAFVND